jgi:hypothetical protein
MKAIDECKFFLSGGGKPSEVPGAEIDGNDTEG